MIEISKEIYKIKGDCNVYLYNGKEPFVIDTGCPGQREMIKEEIEGIVSLDKIKTVLLTHMHYDHCGNVNLFPNASIYADVDEIKDYKNNPRVFFFDEVPKELIKPLKGLKELSKEIKGLRVEKVPGHTHGSTYLVDEKNKLLFSGDTVFNNGVGRTDLENSVPEKMKDSVIKIINELKEKKLTLCPGHDY